MKSIITLLSLFHLTFCSPLVNPSSTDNTNSIPISESISLSPWSDHDRSEVLDSQPIWTTCAPRYLNCRRCPRDSRCQRHSSSSSKSATHPSPTPGLKLPHPHLMPPAPGEPGALTGPQLLGSDLLEQGGQCPLKGCGEGAVADCDSTATCINGYCACKRNMKASSGNMTRGWNFPEALTVYVDAGAVCDQRCQRVDCSEVGKVRGCVDEDNVTGVNDSGTEQAGSEGDVSTTGGSQGQQEPENQTNFYIGHGAIQVPGAGGITAADSAVGSTKMLETLKRLEGA